MDIQQLRETILSNRKYTVAAGVLAAAIFLVLLSGSLLFFIHAIDDNSPITASTVNVPTRVGLLFTYDEPEQVVNHLVFFNDVRLEPGPSDDLYYAVGAAGTKVLVMSKGSKNASDSDLVDIDGTVRLLPSTYILKKKWKLSKEEIKAAHEEGIYIEANRISGRQTAPSRMAKK